MSFRQVTHALGLLSCMNLIYLIGFIAFDYALFLFSIMQDIYLWFRKEG